MKIFDILRNDFATVGIKLPQSLDKYSSFNAKNLINFLFLNLNIFSVFIHIFYDGHTFNDFVDSVYRCIGVVVTAVALMSFVQQTPALFQLIDNLDRAVDKSKFNIWIVQFWLNFVTFLFKHVCLPILGLMNPISTLIYKQTDRKMQKWHHILNILMVKVTPVFANMPKCIVSFYTYFTTDLGRDAFELPCPAWWIKSIDFVWCIFINSSHDSWLMTRSSFYELKRLGQWWGPMDKINISIDVFYIIF